MHASKWLCVLVHSYIPPSDVLLLLSSKQNTHTRRQTCRHTHTRAHMTYKPTYAFPALHYCYSNIQQHCSNPVSELWLRSNPMAASQTSMLPATFFLSYPLLFHTIASLDYCCHGNQGAGPSLGDLETSWSKDLYVIGVLLLGMCLFVLGHDCIYYYSFQML